MPSWLCDEVAAVARVQKFFWPPPLSKEHLPISIPALGECISSQALSSPALLTVCNPSWAHKEGSVPFFASAERERVIYRLRTGEHAVYMQSEGKERFSESIGLKLLI